MYGLFGYIISIQKFSNSFALSFPGTSFLVFRSHLVVGFFEYLTVGTIRTDEFSTALSINGLIVTICCGIDECGTSALIKSTLRFLI